jgi:TM2 domain-containing membrane protein YozV
VAQCPTCGANVKPDASRCPKCGGAVEAPAPAAAPAGAAQVPQIVFVQQAAAQPAAPAQVQVQALPIGPAKTRVAYVLLGLFLGCLGIHNFYAGYTGKGIAQLLICVLTGWLIVPLLIVGIWVLIEIITVKKDATGRAFA